MSIVDSRRAFGLDLTEFADGAPNSISGRGARNWTSGFRARPHLIDSLIPTLRARLVGSVSTSSVGGYQAALRELWRFLDTVDEVARVDKLEDVSDIHGALWVRSVRNPANYEACKSLLIQARQAQNLPPLFWPHIPSRPPRPSDLLDDRVLRFIYHDLRRCLRTAWTRWEEAKEQATLGRDVVGSKSRRHAWCTEDIYATYLSAAAKLGEPFPRPEALSQILEYGKTPVCRAWGTTLRTLYGKFFPLKEDVEKYLWLFVIQTGWNAQVALDLDVSTTAWFYPHPTAEGLVIIRGWKTRGGTEQSAISGTKSPFAPFRLIDDLVRRTEPLRARLRISLDEKLAALRNSPNDTRLTAEVARLRYASRSPWLFYDPAEPESIGVVAPQAGAHYHSWHHYIDDLNKREQERVAQILALGSQARPAIQVPTSVTVSDFRDAFVGFAYARSGHHWLIAKLAAGHKSLNALKHYLRHRQWRQQGERRVGAFQDAMWDEIERRRIVDPAMLRALVERRHVTEEQRLRWEEHKDRTRVGMGCMDFLNPPAEIAPQHREGSGCRIQRCTLCRHGIVFEDSVDLLCRRQAELEHLHMHIALLTWLETSFPIELEATKDTLQQFDVQRVAERLSYWKTEIAEGRHSPPWFEGEYE